MPLLVKKEEGEEVMMGSSEGDDIVSNASQEDAAEQLVKSKARRQLDIVHLKLARISNLMHDIRAKKFEPLLNRQDVKEDTQLLKEAVATRTPLLVTVQKYLIGNSKEPLDDYFENGRPIEELLNDFHIARDNKLTKETVELCIPNDRYFDSFTKNMEFQYAECRMNDSLECLRQHITTIRGRIDGKYGVGIFASLITSQLRSLLGVIFDKHPIWIMNKFRSTESKKVDFAAIWAYESEDRFKWRKFYRNMYIDMMTHTWNLRVKNGDYKVVLEGYWRRWPKQEKVGNWDVGGAYDLPVVAKYVRKGRLYRGDPDEGKGEFVAPN